MPDVPLRVGLVASPGTEGYRDFLGQLTGSAFGFQVQVVPVSVQGGGAPNAVARAVTRLCHTDCDVIVVVRGGGSKADLAAFEAEVVARAIALATKPVWTGIGHTGDESLADIVANRACVTPTECGHQLVIRVGQWWESRYRRAGGRAESTGPDVGVRGPGAGHRRLGAGSRTLPGANCGSTVSGWPSAPVAW